MSLDHDFKVSAENYLKAFLDLEAQTNTNHLPNKDLSKHLKVTRASVSQMVKKLAQQGYVRMSRERGYSLSPKGRRRAKELLRAHIPVEMFLEDTLGLSGPFLHKEAEKMEHAVSVKLVNKIDEFLGQPEKDYMGEKIPR